MIRESQLLSSNKCHVLEMSGREKYGAMTMPRREKYGAMELEIFRRETYGAMEMHGREKDEIEAMEMARYSPTWDCTMDAPRRSRRCPSNPVEPKSKKNLPHNLNAGKDISNQKDLSNKPEEQPPMVEDISSSLPDSLETDSVQENQQADESDISDPQDTPWIKTEPKDVFYLSSEPKETIWMAKDVLQEIITVKEEPSTIVNDSQPIDISNNEGRLDNSQNSENMDDTVNTPMKEVVNQKETSKQTFDNWIMRRLISSLANRSNHKKRFCPNEGCNFKHRNWDIMLIHYGGCQGKDKLDLLRQLANNHLQDKLYKGPEPAGMTTIPGHMVTISKEEYKRLKDLELDSSSVEKVMEKEEQRIPGHVTEMDEEISIRNVTENNERRRIGNIKKKDEQRMLGHVMGKDEWRKMRNVTKAFKLTTSRRTRNANKKHELKLKDENLFRTPTPYNNTEDRAIIQYFMKNQGFSRRKGVIIWKLMEKLDVVPGRTWQSLKSRWNVIETNLLTQYGVTMEELLDDDKKDLNKDNFRYFPYSIHEDLKIIKVIKEMNGFDKTGGETLWKTMEKGKLIPNRSWGSIKQRFRKVLVKKIDQFEMDDETRAAFKAIGRKKG